MLLSSTCSVCSAHCAVGSVQWAVCSVHVLWVVCSAEWIVCSVQCADTDTVLCAENTSQCKVDRFFLHCALCSVQCTVLIQKFEVCSGPCAVYSVHLQCAVYVCRARVQT